MIIGVTVTDSKRVQIFLRDELRVVTDADFTPQDARLIATQISNAADRAEQSD